MKPQYFKIWTREGKYYAIYKTTGDSRFVELVYAEKREYWRKHLQLYLVEENQIELISEKEAFIEVL